MLEATIALELILGKRAEAVIIGTLLLFNGFLSLLQERKAANALALLRKSLPDNDVPEAIRPVATTLWLSA
jgi:H+-transporting ATPase